MEISKRKAVVRGMMLYTVFQDNKKPVGVIVYIKQILADVTSLFQTIRPCAIHFCREPTIKYYQFSKL